MIHLTFSFIQGSLQNKQISRAEVWYTSVRKAQEWAQCILALQHANPPVLQGISKENSETYFLISFFDWLYQCHFEVQLYILVLLPDHSHFQEVTSKNLLPLKHMYFLRPPNMLTILENSTGKRIALTVLKFLQVMPIKKEKNCSLTCTYGDSTDQDPSHKLSPFNPNAQSSVKTIQPSFSDTTPPWSRCDNMTHQY